MNPKPTPWWATEEIKETFRNHRRKNENKDNRKGMKGDSGKEEKLPKHRSVDSFVSAKSGEQLAERKTSPEEPYFFPTLHRNRPRQTGHPALVTGQQLPQGNQDAPPGQSISREHGQEENFETVKLDSDEDPDKDSEDDYVFVNKENERVTERNGLRRNWFKFGRRR